MKYNLQIWKWMISCPRLSNGWVRVAGWLDDSLACLKSPGRIYRSRSWMLLYIIYYLNVINKWGTIPCFGLWAQITTPHPPCLFFLFFLKIRGRGSFRFFLILDPAGGSNQTSFLTLQGILHGSPTVRAPFLALRGKKKLSTRDFNVSEKDIIIIFNLTFSSPCGGP